VILGLFWRELLDRGKDDAAGLHCKQLAQVTAAVGLLRSLTQQLPGYAKRGEQLIVEVVAVREHDQRRVIHVEADLSGIEDHGQTLAGTLGMPDNADATVAFHRLPGFLQGFVDGVVLVVSSQNLDQRRTVILVEQEAAQDVQQAGRLTHSANDDFQLRQGCGGKVHAVDGPPLHEPFFIRRERACAGMPAVAYNQKAVILEEDR